MEGYSFFFFLRGGGWGGEEGGGSDREGRCNPRFALVRLSFFDGAAGVRNWFALAPKEKHVYENCARLDPKTET